MFEYKGVYFSLFPFTVFDRTIIISLQISQCFSTIYTGNGYFFFRRLFFLS